jgi:WD40 repeat protein
MADVFISYSRRDGEFVRRLAADLEASGKSVWIDTQGIGDGEVFPDAIRRAIEGADGFVFVITPESVASRYCENEVDYALELNKRVVPVLRAPVEDAALPQAIGVRNWIPYTPDVDAGAALQRLMAALETDLEHARAHTHWLVRALDWDAHARDRSFLLRGSELAAADAWLAGVADRAEPAPTALQRDYVYTSRTASSRRQRLVVGASLIAVVIALSLAVVALISRSQAQSAQARATGEALQAKSRVWAAESAAQLVVDPERSILLAMAAVRESPTADAVFALRRALDVSPLRVRLPDVGSQATPAYWGAGASYSPDGRRIVEGSQDGSVRIFAAQTGRLLRRVVIGSAAPIVEYSPDGRLIAVADRKDVRLIDAKTGRTTLIARIPGEYAGNLAFSPDGSAVYFANSSHVVRWDLRRDRLRFLATGNIRGVGGAGGLFFAVVSPDGRRLVVGGWPGVALIDAHTGRVLATNTRIPSIWWLALSADGRRIAVTDSPVWPSAGVAGSIDILDARTLRLARVVGPKLDGDAYTALAFSGDDTRLAFGTNEGSAGVIDLRTGNELVSLPGHTTNIYQVLFSPDGRMVTTAAGDGRAFVWRAAGNQQHSIRTDGFSTAADGWLNADLYWPANRIVARYQPISGPDAGRQVVEVWNRSSAGSRRVFGPRGGSFVRVSGNGRFVLLGASSAGKISRLEILGVDGHVLHRFGGMVSTCCPAISHDGGSVAFARSGSQLEVFTLASGRTLDLGTSRCNGWGYWDFSADDRRIAASALCGEVKVWDARSGRPLGRPLPFLAFMNLGPVRFSPSGRLLAVANSGNVGQVSVVDLTDDHTIAVLNGDTKGIQDLTFSPNSSLLATASLDGTARIWNARTGQPLRILDDPTALDNIAFSSDGRAVATLDYSGVINTWDACSECTNPTALLTQASHRVTRGLTAQERPEFRLG